MLLSLNWLKDFVNIPKSITPKKLGELLTAHTAEVDSVKNLGENLDNIVVGKVMGIRKHPNADKLFLVEVDVGLKKMEVVCGAKNLQEGMLVAFAKVGAWVRWHGEGDLVKLEKARIRGVESEGMICAASEIGLGNDSEGIMDISAIGARPGVALKKALSLDDVVLDVDNKSITHRPDLWGHYGMAREISAILRTKLKPLSSNNGNNSRGAALLTRPRLSAFRLTQRKPGKEGGRYSKSFATDQVNFKIKIGDYKKCRRFMGVVVDDIKIGPSPEWMQKRLRAVGLRPISNIVDITNYILYEIGQPMHAYDRRNITGDMLGTRTARQGEKFVILDGEERELGKDDLLVIDGKKGVCLAGIMGGQNTEIKDDTASIILEAANFDPITIRKTSMRLGLRSDSSARFEKGLDPNLPEIAINRALQLIFEICPGARVVSEIIDRPYVAGKAAGERFKLDQGPIGFSYQFLIDRIGVDIPRARAEEILKSLGFEVQGRGVASRRGRSASTRPGAAGALLQKDWLIVKVPTWRATGDISIPEDIVEEVARIYGYDNIPVLTPKVDLRPAPINLEKQVEEKIKDLLAFGFGMTEVYNYAFANEKQLDGLGIDYSDHLRVSNPLASNQTLLKQSLIPDLIDKTRDNLRYFAGLRLFEISKVFCGGKGKPALPADRGAFSAEEKMAAGVLVENQEPLYLIRGIVDGLGKRLGIGFGYEKVDPLYGQGVCLAVLAGQDRVGVLGEMDIGEKLPMGFFELRLKSLVEHYNPDTKFKPLPKFPEICLDLAVVLDKSVQWEDVRQVVFKIGGELVRAVELFDIYKGSKIDPDKKSLAFHIVYRADDRTLESREAEEIQDRIIKTLERRLGAKIRT